MRYLLLCLFTCCLWSADAEPAARVVKDTPWCTITAPASVARGEKADIQVQVKAGAITSDSKLHIDVHKFVGKDRKPGAGRAGPKTIAAGSAVDTTYSYAPPEDAAAIVFVIYVMPSGATDWKSHSHSSEVAVKIH